MCVYFFLANFSRCETTWLLKRKLNKYMVHLISQNTSPEWNELIYKDAQIAPV